MHVSQIFIYRESGLSPLLLKRACITPSNPLFGANCLSTLTAFLQKLINGELPANISPFFFGAILIALKKKDGGTRPIAIGETLRRLGAKLVLHHLEFPFSPFQFGIKTKQGMEIIVHKLRRIVESSISNPFNTHSQHSIPLSLHAIIILLNSSFAIKDLLILLKEFNRVTPSDLLSSPLYFKH